MNGDIISIAIETADLEFGYSTIVNGILNYASIFKIANIKFYGICKTPHDFKETVRLSIDLDKNIVMAPSVNKLNIDKYMISSNVLTNYLKNKGNTDEI